MADTQSNNTLAASIEARGLRVGNTIKVADAGSDSATTASTTIYSDASGKLAAGGLPFTPALNAGVTSTASAVFSVEGSTTGAANVSMTQTVVQGASGSLTTTGFLRITLTDDAGNLTNGAYYIPFGTLA
jgi:hypothetical protein